jgi:hypothetical protein
MLMSIGILTSSAFAFHNTNTDSSDTLYQLVTLAENVLFGKNLESALSFLASGSTVVSSSRIADLHSVLAGKDSSIRVVEDSTRRSMGAFENQRRRGLRVSRAHHGNCTTQGFPLPHVHF